MKFLAIELFAIDEVVSSRFFQSIEFDAGQQLVSLIKRGNHDESLSPRIKVNYLSDGAFLSASSVDQASKFLVLDLEQMSEFCRMPDGDVLFVVQKLLRFAKKIWQGLAFNFGERIFSGTTKAVLFPFGGYQQSPFRVTIEREPWAERTSKRGYKGNFLLAHKAGHEGADATKDIANLTNFRKSFEALTELQGRLREQAKVERIAAVQVDQLQVVTLGDSQPSSPSSLYRKLSDWLPLLTKQQRRFVSEPVGGPYRIEGAAGTGKTLCLMLKAIFNLAKCQDEDRIANYVFVTHSDATKRTISEVLSVLDPNGFAQRDRKTHIQTLKICTLSELCAEELRQSISASEFIDRDAMESKGLQLLYINECLDEVIAGDLPSHERFLSRDFLNFLRTEDRWKIAEMVQHEISVMIKGRAAEDLDRYKKLAVLKYGLPIAALADKGFVFTIFRAYQKRLGSYGQFDTDDVVLTATGQLDTPIWRRRRAREGYDAIFVDESHLFNINELMIFHYFTKAEGPYPIMYSIDRSQAVGDRGWTSDDIADSLVGKLEGKADDAKQEQIHTVFRSSPEIVNLAFSVVASAATLFTNFDNPMDAAASAFTEEEERLATSPRYHAVVNDHELIERAFEYAEAMVRELGCRRSDVLVVSLTDNLVEELVAFALGRNKAHLLLTKRGDTQAVKNASASGQLVIGHADYVGGLEFHGVVLVGIDNGRVPPAADDANMSSKNFLSYASHNRLYVAVSRAKYRVEILGESARGPSRLLLPAMNAGLLQANEP